MTVAELRAECRKRGLPCYQHHGRRLRKADLVAMLATAPAPYGVEPVPPRKTNPPRVPAMRLTDDDRLTRELAAMAISADEQYALYRMLRGTHTAKHDGILRRREAMACQRLAERATTERGRLRWHSRYLRCTGVVS